VFKGLTLSHDSRHCLPHGWCCSECLCCGRYRVFPPHGCLSWFRVSRHETMFYPRLQCNKEICLLK